MTERESLTINKPASDAYIDVIMGYPSCILTRSWPGVVTSTIMFGHCNDLQNVSDGVVNPVTPCGKIIAMIYLFINIPAVSNLQHYDN